MVASDDGSVGQRLEGKLKHQSRTREWYQMEMGMAFSNRSMPTDRNSIGC